MIAAITKWVIGVLDSFQSLWTCRLARITVRDVKITDLELSSIISIICLTLTLEFVLKKDSSYTNRII